MVITVGNIKGGVGKTTIAINLAVFLTMQDKNVALVDADPQASATMFTKMRNNSRDGNIGYELYPFTDDYMFDQLARIQMKHDFVIIDAGGRDSKALRASVVKSNIFICPFKPRVMDVWTAPAMNELMHEVQSLRIIEPVKAYTFLNMADAAGTDNDEAQELMNEMKHLTFVPNRIGNRKIYSKSIGAGSGVMEVESKDAATLKAKKEMQELFIKILNGDLHE